MNLNDQVKVRLSEHDRDWLRQFYTNIFKDWPEQPGSGYPRRALSREQVIRRSLDLHKPKEDDYVYFQLWCLIDIFGGTIRMGHPLPFESTELELVNS